MLLSTQNRALRSFTQLSKRHQLAVELKSYGMPHTQIAEEIVATFKKPCSPNTVNQWFAVNGMLVEAYHVYNTHIGEEALVAAGNDAKRSIKLAIMTLNELMCQYDDPKLRLQSAQAILRLLSPQMLATQSEQSKEDSLDDLLAEISAALDRIAAGKD